MTSDGKLNTIKEMLTELDDIRESCEKIHLYGICKKECNDSCLMHVTETRKKKKVREMIQAKNGHKN